MGWRDQLGAISTPSKRPRATLTRLNLQIDSAVWTSGQDVTRAPKVKSLVFQESDLPADSVNSANDSGRCTDHGERPVVVSKRFIAQE